MVNPYEHDEPVRDCDDCGELAWGMVVMYRITPLGKHRAMVCQACADRFASAHGTNADDEAYDRAVEDGAA
jgi:protein-arginine kinase activator protein McsA